MGLTTYTLNALTNHLYRNINFPTTQVWLGLIDGSNNEIIGTDYARQRLDDKMANPSNGNSSSNAAVQFPISGNSWGNVSGVGLWDNSTGGNLLQTVALPDSINVGANVIVRFPAESIELGFGDE